MQISKEIFMSNLALKSKPQDLDFWHDANSCHLHVAHERLLQENSRLAELAAKGANERISVQQLIDRVPDYMWVKDRDSRFLIANRALAIDCRRATHKMIGLTDFDIHPPEVARDFRELELEIIRTGRHMIDREELVVDAGGKRKWLSSTKVPLRDDFHEIVGIIGIARDITSRKLAEAMRDGQAYALEMIATNAPLDAVFGQLARLVESQHSGLCCAISLLEKDGMTLRHAAAPSLGRAFIEAIDAFRVGPDAGSCGAAASRRQVVVAADISSDPLWKEHRAAAAAHGLRSCWSTPIISTNGAVLGAFAAYSIVVREPTLAETQAIESASRVAGIAIDRRRSEDRIHYLANHDALTGLPNRSLLKDRLAQATLYAKRYDRCATVAFLDLDNFKLVNDSLGHDAGDELLRVVAARISGCLRATDTVVRLGGDEFVVVLFDQPNRPDAAAGALQKICAAIAEPIAIGGRPFKVTASVGVASYPRDGEDADALLANADAAMYRTKENGRDGVSFYTPEINVKVRRKFAMQEELRTALARSEFVVHYQPQVDLRTNRVFAVEALVRWNHPTRGMVAPADFIPLAEETGLIGQIGEWVLLAACRENKAWQDAGLPAVTVCVNVSARQFREKNWTSRVIWALEQSGMDAKHLELELTESMILHDLKQTAAAMVELRTLGVQFAIDDFGTGYSSLTALKSLPVSRLKIDKSFVDDLQRNDEDRAIAKTVIALGQNLNLRVIAEGVENAEQLAFLRDNQCDEMQGYHFSRPIVAEAIAAMLGKQAASSDALP